MQIIIRKFTNWAYSSDSFIKKWRSQRMDDFISLVQPPRAAKIIDLGGTPYMWNLLEHDFNITLVNLPGTIADTEKVPSYTYVEGDATNLSSLFKDKAFDIVYSNSTIEHVGGEKKQADFAAEVHRLADSYWVQTPSDRWPIEAHTGIPFYWQLPATFRDKLIQSWQEKLPAWAEFIKETRVLSRAQMKNLFPGGELYVERKFLLEKSYVFYKQFKGSKYR